MVETYSAFGLTLRSTFSLPGMRPARATGLPSIEIAIESPAGLRDSWSGPARPALWRGRLGDGEELTIQWGIGGDLLFAYGERALFRLDADGSRLDCAPRDRAALDWQRVLLTRVLPNVSLAHGREALHASAVETPLGVVAIAAPSGTGKSTLAAQLTQRGWPLFADDVLILEQGPTAVKAHAATPHMNVSLDASDPQVPGVTLGVLSGERWVAGTEALPASQEVAAVVILERHSDLALAALDLPSSPLTLAPYMLGLPDESARHASHFALYSDLVESARLLRLTAAPTDRPEDLAETLERALDLSASVTAGAA